MDGEGLGLGDAVTAFCAVAMLAPKNKATNMIKGLFIEMF